MTYPNLNSTPCEFTIPIKLNIPIDIYPIVNVHPAPAKQEKLPVYLQPDLFLTPQVLAQPQKCDSLPENGQEYNRQQLPTQPIQPSP
ncbi:hypothetical protein LC593_14135 [Nostoc sp. CHAB 5844]|nr:hypothetical protein [Nostoc sp. CHAB 5844]